MCFDPPQLGSDRSSPHLGFGQGEESVEEGVDGGWSFGVDAAAEYYEKGLLDGLQPERFRHVFWGPNDQSWFAVHSVQVLDLSLGLLLPPPSLRR